ncbi:heterokaryon incompatibility protein-domain-containing protein, partial [Pyrenochaeta sp. MPI-SDFR-AT-0127]
MRLIHAASLELQRFDNDLQLPAYSILSHTWGSDEVNFERFRNLHSASPATRAHVENTIGYRKIWHACQLALLDGYTHVWVDTCCIDKTSSAELSEAINSMFWWYRRANVCYAYLDDVDAEDTPGSIDIVDSKDGKAKHTTAASISKETLSHARWFTRGWTLQELIAPSKVLFYVKEWRYIGSKESKTVELADITGISEQALRYTSVSNRYFNQDQMSIAEKMGWMARRSTTRVEDLAYSLLGIFGVNMPLLYGEGPNAFVRLQEEIMRDSDDHSLFAWSSPPPYDGHVRPIHGFAQSPSRFANSGAMFANPYVAGGGEPYALTNKGIRIQLRILPYKITKSPSLPTFLAILECSYEHKSLQGYRPGIIIKR